MEYAFISKVLSGHNILSNNEVGMFYLKHNVKNLNVI